MIAKIEHLWFVTERRTKRVFLERKQDPNVQVIVKKVSRDKDQKLTYETIDTLNLYDAKGEEVVKICTDALSKAAAAK